MWHYPSHLAPKRLCIKNVAIGVATRPLEYNYYLMWPLGPSERLYIQKVVTASPPGF